MKIKIELSLFQNRDKRRKNVTEILLCCYKMHGIKQCGCRTHFEAAIPLTKTAPKGQHDSITHRHVFASKLG